MNAVVAQKNCSRLLLDINKQNNMHTTPTQTDIAVLVVATLVITSALIASTVTQRAMSFHHWWYLCLLHLILQSLIHLSCPCFVNIHQYLHRTQCQRHKLIQYLVGLQLIHKIRGLGEKLCACASASSARNIQYAQLTHSATIENRVSDLRRHAHFNIEWRVYIFGHLHPAVDRE